MFFYILKEVGFKGFMDPNFIQQTQNWIQLDNEAIKLKAKLKEILDARKDLEEEILTYVHDNDLGKVTLNISDGQLKFSQVTSRQSISMKYLREMLGKYNDTSGYTINADDIYKFLVDNLEVKKELTLKRSIISP